MFSQAASDGTLTLTITFKLGTDANLAQQLVQNRVNQALPHLPEVTQRIGVTTIKSSPDLTMVVHLTSPNGRYDMLYLRNYAVLNVKDQLAKIQGIGQVQSVRLRRLRDARLAQPGEGRRARPDRRRGRRRHPRAERAGLRRRHRRSAVQDRAWNSRSRSTSRAGSRTRSNSATWSSSATPTAWSPCSRTWPAWRSRLPSTACARCSTTTTPWPCRSSRCPARTRSTSPTTFAPRWPS